MKTDRIYPILVVVLILLLMGSGVLAYIFFQMLTAPQNEPGAEGVPAEQAGASGLPGGSQAGGSWRGGAATYTAPGTDGGSGKWAPRTPGSQPVGVGPNLAGTYPDERGGAWGPAFMGMPLTFDENCDDYGGEYSLLASGADLDIILAPGNVCLTIQRPEVYVQQNQTNQYHVGDITYDACKLDQSLNMCFTLGNITPDARGRAWHPLYAPTPVHDRAATTVLEEWHAPFADDRDITETSQRDRQTDVIADAPDPPPESTIERNSFYLGNNPAEWFSDLPAAARSTYLDIRPGVDLSCYADQNRLEYVFVFWPGVDPQDIEFTYDSAHNISQTAHGNLAIEYDCATLIQHQPLAYKWLNGAPVETPVNYSIHGKTVSLDFMDASAPTAAAAGAPTANSPILRPIVDYLSYLGGEGDDRGYAVAVDHVGYVYVAGTSTSPDFSTGKTPKDKRADNTDVFVTKIRISDRQVMYTTFLGGRHDERAFDIAADAEGNAYVCGETLSPDFATVTPPPGGVLGRGWDAFVVKLDPQGAIGNYAFRLGGRADDRAFGIAVDAATNLYVGGVTYSPDFPTTPGSFGAGEPPAGESADTFIAKISGNGRDLLYSARFGGSGDDFGYALAVDRDGSAIVAGETFSTDLPLETPVQMKTGGGKSDGFVARLAPDGKHLGFATYLGGKGDDRILGLDVDLARSVYVTGETASDNFPTQNALQPQFAGGQWDAFLTRLAPAGNAILFSTYLGGSGDDRGFAVAAEASGEPHVGGTTSSTNLPVVRPLQKNFGGGKWDAFIAGFGEGGQDVHYLTYLGGTNDDQIAQMAMEAGHLLHFAGSTQSGDLPVVEPFQSAHRGGGNDVLLGRFLSGPPQSPPMRLVPAGGMPNGPFYDYLMSAFEITNEEFARFLNDAQANPDGPRGTNMFFDAYGSVWMNPDMIPERDELFTLADGRLVYEPAYPIGARYNVTPRASREGGSYARHPVSGVSWYGAVKYCNWLTVETGRGPDHRCYREGIHPADWAPVTCPAESWERGLFTSSQRHAWLRYKGFRLPMDNCAALLNRNPLYFRASNAEFADFLNDAEANPFTLRGTNIYIDAIGNANFTPDAASATGRLFSIDGSLLTFEPTAPVGGRFSVQTGQPGAEPPFAKRPVSNVSWYGAMKYCNWLTLMEGMDPKERGYREGHREQDWAPTTASQEGWARGDFTEREREAWLQLKGYRLPFVSDSVATNALDDVPGGGAPTNSWPNAFNEVAKAAGWSSSTNVQYGFGRNDFDLHDANYLDSGMSARHDTTPVGFYDGSDHGGRFPTRTNDNLYGAFDLSGNVSEWVSDPGGVGSLADRAYYGGSWRFPLATVNERFYVHPYFTENFMGFRVVTTAAGDDMYVARVPFRLCVCGYGVGPGCGRMPGGEEEGKPEEEIKPRGEGLTLGPTDPLTGSQGVTTKPTQPPPPTTVTQPGGGGGGGKPPPPPTTTGIISDFDDGGGQSLVVICHHSPGNPGQTQTISVPLAAVPTHLAHGDTIGPCP
ncbi:MAG: SUMF1/EgtB/PvdO family nonheme iron enzyme [Lentisphaerae bacterium]|nr:SUMF1/EgtB/PvdO family nonheme iron enzyme [Lentisphaerota bacterium]